MTEPRLKKKRFKLKIASYDDCDNEKVQLTKKRKNNHEKLHTGKKDFIARKRSSKKMILKSEPIIDNYDNERVRGSDVNDNADSSNSKKVVHKLSRGKTQRLPTEKLHLAESEDSIMTESRSKKKRLKSKSIDDCENEKVQFTKKQKKNKRKLHKVETDRNERVRSSNENDINDTSMSKEIIDELMSVETQRVRSKKSRTRENEDLVATEAPSKIVCFKIEPVDNYDNQRVWINEAIDINDTLDSKEIIDKLPVETAEARSSDEDDIDIISRSKRAAEILSPEQIAYFRSLVVELRHEVLPQHEVEKSAGSRVPSASEKEEFEKLSDGIRRGTFDKTESQIIVNNWKAFCELHYWTPDNPQPFLFHRHHYHFYLPKREERKKFVQFLADGLPDRTLYSVYHRFRNIYDTHKVAKYSNEEDAYIIQHIEEHKNVDGTRKFADLGKALNRTRASVWRRYRLLTKKRRIQKEDDSG